MIRVTKQNGETENFDERKLERGLRRAGASREAIEQVKRQVKRELFDGISTKQIFAIAFREFRKVQPVASQKYNIKEALMRLGKTGFPFEAYIERVLMLEGYKCRRNQVVQGSIITHEIDVDASKDSDRLMVECKFRTKPWLSTHIQTGLYVYARFLDVQKIFTQPMLVTNTKFSPQVIQYAKGVNMKLMGWHYPGRESLEKTIERHDAYPVTLLPSMTDEMLDVCLQKGYLLLSDVKDFSASDFIREFGVSKRKAASIIQLCTICRSLKKAEPRAEPGTV